MWLYGQKTLKESFHPAKFGGHKDCGSRELVVGKLLEMKPRWGGGATDFYSIFSEEKKYAGRYA